jgi:hypothetical protein
MESYTSIAGDTRGRAHLASICRWAARSVAAFKAGSHWNGPVQRLLNLQLFTAQPSSRRVEIVLERSHLTSLDSIASQNGAWMRVVSGMAHTSTVGMKRTPSGGHTRRVCLREMWAVVTERLLWVYMSWIGSFGPYARPLQNSSMLVLWMQYNYRSSVALDAAVAESDKFALLTENAAGIWYIYGMTQEKENDWQIPILGSLSQCFKLAEQLQGLVTTLHLACGHLSDKCLHQNTTARIYDTKIKASNNDSFSHCTDDMIMWWNGQIGPQSVLHYNPFGEMSHFDNSIPGKYCEVDSYNFLVTRSSSRYWFSTLFMLRNSVTWHTIEIQ